MGSSSSKPQTETSENSVLSLSNDLQGKIDYKFLYFLLLCPLTFTPSQEQMIKEYNDEQVLKLFGKQIERLGEQKATLVKGIVILYCRSWELKCFSCCT